MSPSSGRAASSGNRSAHGVGAGTEERSYGNSARPGLGEAGFDAAEWKTWVDAAGGDVAQALRDWMVDTGRPEAGAALTHLEVRGWIPA
ncbi:hypothetical protein [Streptomyces sp. NPDC046727]|uniref:hypothetical protein n=1 Tax=Streptomyces sp. NPDC046727 TaxID=3155373 RepID=UPI0033D56F7B